MGLEPVNTLDYKFVADYAGVPLISVEDLGIFEFYMLLHDAAVWQLSQSEKGREYLETASRLRITEPNGGLKDAW